jgi:hypothetical protein
VKAVTPVSKAQSRDTSKGVTPDATNIDEEEWKRRDHLQCLAALREVKPRWVKLLNYEADRLPMSKRPWFRITEIADYCAKNPGSVEPDSVKRERTIELLRRAILRGEFEDANGRSRVACLHISPITTTRFDRGSAADTKFFQLAVPHLWLSRADSEDWYRRNALTFPWKTKRQQNRRGRPLKWNWPQAHEKLDAEVKANGRFQDRATMLDFAIHSVTAPDGTAPDPKSAKDMAEKYNWFERFVVQGK